MGMKPRKKPITIPGAPPSILHIRARSAGVVADRIREQIATDGVPDLGLVRLLTQLVDDIDSALRGD